MGARETTELDQFVGRKKSFLGEQNTCLPQRPEDSNLVGESAGYDSLLGDLS